MTTPETSRLEVLTRQVDVVRSDIDELGRHAKSLRVGLDENTAALKWRTRVLAVGLIALTIVVFLALGRGTQVALENQREIRANNEKWCPLFEAVVPRPTDAPPATTPAMKARMQIAEKEFLALAKYYGCRVP